MKNTLVMQEYFFWDHYATGIYLLKITNENIRKMSKMFKLTKVPEGRKYFSGYLGTDLFTASTVDFEQVNVSWV